MPKRLRLPFPVFLKVFRLVANTVADIREAKEDDGVVSPDEWAGIVSARVYEVLIEHPEIFKRKS